MAVKSGRGGSLLKDLKVLHETEIQDKISLEGTQWSGQNSEDRGLTRAVATTLSLMYQQKSQRVSWVGSGLQVWSGWGLW